MRVFRWLSLGVVVLFLAACSTNTSSPPQPLASVEARIAYLQSQGILVQKEKVVERDKDMEFPFGECGAVLHFFDQRAQLDVFKGDAWPLEVLYGDDIKNAGKTAKTQVCKVGDQPASTSQSPLPTTGGV